jgi:hypothetical protein
MFQSINSTITKFAKYKKTFNHKTQETALNKYIQVARNTIPYFTARYHP